MKIAIGADHGGYRLKEELLVFLREKGEKIKDFGMDSEVSCDYPDIAAAVAGYVSAGRATQGILICTTGIGMAITANKFLGIRAAACYNEDAARMAREHNDANILVLGSKYTSAESARKILAVWFKTSFSGDALPRHKRRIEKIEAIEKDIRRQKE